LKFKTDDPLLQIKDHLKGQAKEVLRKSGKLLPDFGADDLHH
jgi:hypothetical protein